MTRNSLAALFLVAIQDSWLLPCLLPLRENNRRIAYGKKEWDQEYASGRWNFLHSLNEAGHYHLIAGYFKTLFPQGKVLDVGCGEGIIVPILKPDYADYVGIDIAETAIQKASANADGRTIFLCCDAKNFTTDKRFDTIIFNEALYYFDDPVTVINHYRQFLAKDGVFIVSMAMGGLRNGLHKLKIWRDISRYHDTISKSSLHTQSYSWVVKVMKPRY